MAVKKTMSATKKVEPESKNEVATSNEGVATIQVEKKKYENEDSIMCRSITNGGLYVIGERTKFLYSFADYGDEVAIEYQDLIYMIRSHDKAVFEPRFVILEDDIVSEHKDIEKLYDALYSVNDLKEIIDMPTNQMASVINQLPKGAIESLKGIVSTMIDNGKLDSVSKIKALDEILGTNLLLVLAQN